MTRPEPLANATSKNVWARQLFEWVDARFPLAALWKSQVAEYYGK
jgi:hypothetical protein